MRILDHGQNYTLRPMQRPQFHDYFVKAQENTWNVQELDFTADIQDLKAGKLSAGELHMIKRLVAFFATGDEIVNDNVCLNLYKHVNSPEYRMYVTRQAFEESVHVDGYLKLLDVYLVHEHERKEAFDALETIPSIRKKGKFCFKWMVKGLTYDTLESSEQRRQFLLSVITFGAAVEGLGFIAAFAYIYFLRSRGKAQGFAILNDWVARDESMHMEVAFELVHVIRSEYPELWDQDLIEEIKRMMDEAVILEIEFAADVLSERVTGLPLDAMAKYIRFTADQRLLALGIPAVYGDKNPLDFMGMQGLQPLTNFFERRVTEYGVGVSGDVGFDETF